MVLNSENLPAPWLSLNQTDLSINDKKTIVEGEQLTDKHINYAQAILKKQFDWLGGLHSRVLNRGDGI